MGIGVHYCDSERSRKRKAKDQENEIEGSNFPLNYLNQDLLEQVLSWLPTSSFFRVISVCKRWKSVADCATFLHSCSQISSRDPWYFMVDSNSIFNTQPIVFDSSENNWKWLNFPPLFQQKQSSFVPVAASGGLICFQSEANQFIICNPVTGTARQIVSCNFQDQESKTLKAIAMDSSLDSYKLVLIYGENSEFSFRVYNSKANQWEEEIRLTRKSDGPNEPNASEDENPGYFLSKCGNVVSTDLERSPCKQYSSVITKKNEEEIIYFLSSSGRVISCNVTNKFYFEYPRLLPLHHEYSIDLIESDGEVFVVVLSEFLESASLRVWRFDEIAKFWHQIAAMPPAMSHEFCGKKVDINCTGGSGKKILVCLNSAEICRYVLCNLVNNEWTELPNCYVNGKSKEFSCAFSFEPRIEASV